MIKGRGRTDPSDRSEPSHLSRLDPPHPGFAQLEDHPDLIPVLTEAVDQVLTISNIDKERDADLEGLIRRSRNFESSLAVRL
jgi:hypothetical protein